MIVARFKVHCRPERTEEVAAAITAVEAASRQLPGVIQFDVARSLTDSNAFIVIEVFEDRAALERQEAQREVAAVLDLVEAGALARPVRMDGLGSLADGVGPGGPSADNGGMVPASEKAVAFRLWPPVAVGAPLLVGWVATQLWGDPVDLGGWRVPLGWALVLVFAGWNGWALWLFRSHETGLLPGQATHDDDRGGSVPAVPQPVVRRAARALPRAGLAGPDVLGPRAVPCPVLLLLWGAIRPEEQFLHERFGAAYDDYTRRVRRWL